MTLDLWHTLVYLEPEAEEAYMAGQLDLATAALRGGGPEVGSERPGSEKARSAFSEEYRRAVREAEDGRSVTPAEQLARAAARLGVRVDRNAYLSELAALVRRNPFRPAPGVLEMLGRLRASGYRTAVISNTIGEPGASLRPMLTDLGIDRNVDTFVFSDERPWTKPAEAIFHDALATLGVRPDLTVHVGDGWSDIEGARRARLRAGVLFTGLQRYGDRYRELFLGPDWHDPPTPYRVGQLSEVPDLVAALFDRPAPNGRDSSAAG